MNKIMCANGWTKETILARFKERNNNTKCGFNKITRSDEFYFYCCYENEENHCAIGCFIPDGHPANKTNYALVTLFGIYPELKSSMPFNDNYMLYLFQKVHDNYRRDDNLTLYETIELWLNQNVVDEPIIEKAII